jgi:hypothetical protein
VRVVAAVLVPVEADGAEAPAVFATPGAPPAPNVPPAFKPGAGADSKSEVPTGGAVPAEAPDADPVPAELPLAEPDPVPGPALVGPPQACTARAATNETIGTMEERGRRGEVLMMTVG